MNVNILSKKFPTLKKYIPKLNTKREGEKPKIP